MRRPPSKSYLRDTVHVRQYELTDAERKQSWDRWVDGGATSSRVQFRWIAGGAVAVLVLVGMGIFLLS